MTDTSWYFPLTKVRRQLEFKMKQRFVVYDALLYRSQVVAGTNYLIKVLQQGVLVFLVYLIPLI